MARKAGETMPDSIKLGIIGYGYAGRVFHAPLAASVPGLELAAFVSGDPAKVAADWPGIPVDPSPEALFSRPELDLVVIASPNDTHYPLASQALAAGKHVIVDKPFTLTPAEARSLNDQAERAGRLLSVFHNRRWDADFLTLRGLIESGRLGRVVRLESRFDRFRPQVRERWREAGGPGSGLWYDLGPHLLDQALQLFGLPDALTVDLALQRDGARSDDYFHAQLRYRDARVLLGASALVAEPGPRFAVHGTLGSYLKFGLDPQEDRLKAGQRPPATDWGLDAGPGRLTAARPGRPEDLETCLVPNLAGDYPAYYAAIRDALLGLGANPVTPREAIQVMDLIELGLASAAARRELAVPQY
jgi:predicted dehydrogenase